MTQLTYKHFNVQVYGAVVTLGDMKEYIDNDIALLADPCEEFPDTKGWAFLGDQTEDESNIYIKVTYRDGTEASGTFDGDQALNYAIRYLLDLDNLATEMERKSL